MRGFNTRKIEYKVYSGFGPFDLLVCVSSQKFFLIVGNKKEDADEG
jgi:hypothetical protein